MRATAVATAALCGAVVVAPVASAAPEVRPAAAGARTIGVYRVSDATFYLRDASTTGDAQLTVRYGGPTGVPLVGNWS